MKILIAAALLAGSALPGVADANPCVEWWQPLSHPPVHSGPCHEPPEDASPECPALATMAPGIPGVVDISPEGDVAIAGSPFWDCPPYDD